jgi:hypothetical protein
MVREARLAAVITIVFLLVVFLYFGVLDAPGFPAVK